MKNIFVLLFFFTTICFANNKSFQVGVIEQDSFFDKIQLKSGDKITQINNKKIHNINDVMNFMSDTKSIKSVFIIRDGTKQEIKL